MLRRSVTGGVQNLPRQAHGVARAIEGLDKLVEESAVGSDREAFHVLENEGARVQLGNKPHEFENETIAGVFDRSMPD